MSVVVPATPTIRADGAWVVEVTPPPALGYQCIAPGQAIAGRRVVWMDHLGWHYDWRALGTFIASDGSTGVSLVDEGEWYAAVREGREPVAVERIEASVVWLEAPGCGTPA